MIFLRSILKLKCTAGFSFRVLGDLDREVWGRVVDDGGGGWGREVGKRIRGGLMNMMEGGGAVGLCRRGKSGRRGEQHRLD